MRGYISTYVDVGEVEVDIDVDELVEQLDDDDLKQIIEAKGYSTYKIADVNDDIVRLSNRVLLKKRDKEDFTKDLDELLYLITGRYA